MPDDEFIDSVSDNGSTYDPDAYYIATRNKKGFKTTLYLAVTPEVAAGLAEVVASRRLPWYRTNHDFFRNAIVHQLHRDRERVNDPALEIVIDDLVASLIVESKTEQIQTIIDAEKAAVETVHALSRQPITDHARRRIMPHVNTMLNAMSDPVAKDQIKRDLGLT